MILSTAKLVKRSPVLSITALSFIPMITCGPGHFPIGLFRYINSSLPTTKLSRAAAGTFLRRAVVIVDLAAILNITCFAEIIVFIWVMWSGILSGSIGILAIVLKIHRVKMRPEEPVVIFIGDSRIPCAFAFLYARSTIFRVVVYYI